MAGPLTQDRVVRWIAALCALAALPLVFPILSDSWTAAYGQHVLEVPFQIILLVAIRYRLAGVTDDTERRFWNLLTIGFACWLGAGILNFLVPLNMAGSLGDIAGFGNNALYLMMYGALAMALEVHPHVRSEPVSGRLLALNRVGSFVVLFGLLAYFLMLPGFQRESPFWASSLALFVSIDAYLLLRLWGLRRATRDVEWRTIYSWLLVAVSAWGIGDVVYMFIWTGFLSDFPYGTLFDLLWPIAFAAVIIATRARGTQVTPPSLHTQLRERFGMGPLVVYAILPPLLHISLYRFASPSLDVRPEREVLVVGCAVVLGALTLAYNRILRGENRRLVEEDARNTERLAHLALHDELTGLPNREMFQDRLGLAIADARRYNRKCAVMFCDLDRFKVINDSLGHEAGDSVLVATAGRLQSCVRVLDTVARFGGDEFTIILQGIGGALDAARLAEKMLDTLGEPILVQGKKHVLTASVGIAVFPEDGVDEGTLLKHADLAMYQAKLQGRNTYRLFTEAMNSAAEERLALERGLREARIEESFVLFYQPVIDIKTRQPVGYEALIRWNHPERGFVQPDTFLDVAERTGLIVPIGYWVLETACSWAVEMTATSMPPPTIAVNLSKRQLGEPELVHEVVAILERTGLDPSRLQLEIPESLAFAVDSGALVLSELRDAGVQISIDDFGTGFAALTRLADLSVDMVKIDRSFVRGIEAGSVGETVVRAIVTMARALDCYVIAEGVETEAELAVLQQLECDAVQGFLLQAPLPAEELVEAMSLLNRSASE